MSAMAELRLVAAGLCHDAGIGVEETDGTWAWSPSRRVILVDRGDLAEMGPNACAGIIAHEVGHALISRYGLAALPPERIGLHRLVLNAIEDPRVEVYMADRYPGARAWIAEAAARCARSGGVAAVLPDTLQFMLGAARSHHDGWRGPDARGLSRAACEALETTQDARRDYACGYLPPARRMPGEDPAALYEAEVVPALAEPPTGIPLRSEMAIQVLAMRALGLAIERVWPHARRLWECDVEAVALWLHDTPDAVRAFKSAEGERKTSVAAACVRAAMDARDPESREDRASAHHDVAEAMLWEAIERSAPAPRVTVSIGFPTTPRSGATSSRSAPVDGMASERPGGNVGREEYERARASVARETSQLVQALDSILAPRAALREKVGYRSGVRADLRTAMSAERRGEGYDRMWLRRTVPDRRRAAFALLVDLSGSMREEKIQAALQACVLFAEALDALKIPHAIRGFQDEVIPFLALGERLGPVSRARIGEMPQEVSGRRRGGHNQPRYNDDGPCLESVARELAAWPSDDRVLIVISDGAPEGRHSSQEDLHDAVARIRRGTPPIALIGLGLGEHATHVRSFYPEHVVEPSVRGLPSRVARLLRERLGQGRQGTAGAVRTMAARGR